MQIHHYKPGWKNFYVAAFPVQPFNAQVEMSRWCYQTFGYPGYLIDTHEIRWTDEIEYGEVKFHREEDLALFLLKWQTQ